MFKQKWKALRQAGKDVRAMRAEFEEQEKHFRCLANKNLVAAGDPFDSNGEPPRHCGKYAINSHCPDTTCPYYEWNTKHYNTYLGLCDAQWNRFGAFLELFVRSKHKEKE